MKVKNLSLKIGRKQILNKICFDVNSRTALIGPNGSGKTMTLCAMSGLVVPDEGEIILQTGEGKSLMESIGAMIQESELEGEKTVREALEYMKELKKDKRGFEEIDMILDECLIDGNMLVRELPHGKHKILLTIQAFMGNPSIVLLDEPFAGLDIINKKIIEKLIKGYKGKMIMASHMLPDAKKVCDDAVFLMDGEVVEQKKLNSIKNLEKYYIKMYSRKM
jgi:ABC-2 type transport system ATP-binding protein